MGTPAHTQRGLGRREALLDAACAVIARSGTRTLRIEDVAREAGVSIGLVYYYFESRDELISFAFEYANERTDAAFAKREQPEGTGLQRVVARLLRELADDPVVLESWMIWNEMTSGSFTQPRLRELLSDAYVGWTKEVAELLDEGRADGSVPGGIDATASAIRLTATMEGLGGRWRTGSIAQTDAHDLALVAIARELGVPVSLA
jgi:TetR/AcrR family transcriptional repressor of bet genes